MNEKIIMFSIIVVNIISLFIGYGTSELLNKDEYVVDNIGGHFCKLINESHCTMRLSNSKDSYVFLYNRYEINVVCPAIKFEFSCDNPELKFSLKSYCKRNKGENIWIHPCYISIENKSYNYYQPEEAIWWNITDD